jgi:hypothetical protein
MTLGDLANVAVIVQGVFLIVSVGFIWYQLYQNTKYLRFANTQKLVELSSPFNLQLIQDRQMAEYWVNGADNYDAMDSVDKYRFTSLLQWWLIFHENAFYQHKQRLIDEETYQPWNYDLEQFVKLLKLEKFWPDLQNYFQAEFAHHVSEIIKKFAAPQPTTA